MIKAPFPYFGGKSKIVGLVWQHLGPIRHYIEPFCGSAIMRLACPYELEVVTLNDADGFISNFWRSILAAPDEVAKWLDYPVIEQDLFARHVWLVNQAEILTTRLATDPDYYDAKIAGWWCWGACAWIGSDWCSGRGPWTVRDGQVINLRNEGSAGQGVNRKLPHLGSAGRGVNRTLSSQTAGICELTTTHLSQYMNELKDALRRSRVCCGDWRRVCDSPATTTKHGLTGVFLDPPYSAEAGRDKQLYTKEDLQVAHQVREWCIKNGDNPLMRIALCGYDVEHTDLQQYGWTLVRWQAGNSYGNFANGNGDREIIWFSPHCLNPLESGKNGHNSDLSGLPMFSYVEE